MATFRFRLQKLLNMRRDARDAQRQQYAQALQAQQILAEQVTQIGEEIEQTRSLLRTNAAPGRVDVDRLLRTHRYELVLQFQQQQLKQQVERVAQEVEKRRLALVQADRDVRVLEKLEEKKLEAFRTDEERRDQKMIDEIAQLRALRQVHET